MKKQILLVTCLSLAVSFMHAQPTTAEKQQLSSLLNRILKTWPVDFRQQVNKPATLDTAARFYQVAYTSTALPVSLQLNNKNDAGRLYISTPGNNNNMLAWFEATRNCLPGKPTDWTEVKSQTMWGYKRADGAVVVVFYGRSSNKVGIEIASAHQVAATDKLPAIFYSASPRGVASFAATLFPPATPTSADPSVGTGSKPTNKTITLTTMVKLVKESPSRYKALCTTLRSGDVFNTNDAFWDFPNRYVWVQSPYVAQYNSSSRNYMSKDSVTGIMNDIAAVLSEGMKVQGTYQPGQFGDSWTWKFPGKLDADKKPYDLLMRVFTGQRGTGEWLVSFLCSNEYKR